jgi:hypothetical protein
MMYDVGPTPWNRISMIPLDYEKESIFAVTGAFVQLGDDLNISLESKALPQDMQSFMSAANPVASTPP